MKRRDRDSHGSWVGGAVTGENAQSPEHHKPHVDNDPSARDVSTVDTQEPHRQAAHNPTETDRLETMDHVE
jgi:hypothetical protein